MNWGELKSSVRALMDELSARGALLPNIKVADILMKLKYFINPVLYELAQTTGRLAAVQYVTLNPVLNTLTYDTSSIKKHLPGIDWSFELAGAKACFFECNGPATVTIDEKIAGVWNNLETINITSTVTALTEYRRLITASDPANTIRLRFTGDYAYDFRNYILYPYTWPTAADVQQHRPYFEVALASDYLKLNAVLAKRDTRQYVSFNQYTVRESDGKLVVDRYLAPLELLVQYWRKPVGPAFTGVDTTDDLLTIDATDEAVHLVPLGVAAKVLLSEKDETAGMILQNLYEAGKVQLVGTGGPYAGTIVSKSEW